MLAGVGTRLTLGQGARLVTGLLWLGWADWWLQTSWAVGPVVALLQTMAAVAVMALAVMVRSEHGQRRLDAGLVAGTLVLIALVGIAGGTASGFGTDELAYGQAAASSVLHGVNPYVTDYTSALRTFGVGSGATLTLHGTPVPSIAYPALSFLLYVPAVALMGVTSYAGLLVDLLAWVVAGALLWRLMSAAVRPWVPLFLAVPVLFEAVIFGTNDSLYIPFELLAVCCWDRFGDPHERSVARWVGPVALGLACCIKQPPWLIAPFLLAGVGFEAQRRGQDWRRACARYLAIVVAVFLIPNLPFIVWSPSGWLSRVLLPVTGGLVPMGIGPANMLRALGIGGGNLSLFGVASLCAIVAALAAYIAHYRNLRAVIPLLPLAALFVSARSFSSYFGFCVPALAVNAATVGSGDTPRISARARRIANVTAALAATASVAALGTALAWPAPVTVSVDATTASSTALLATVTVENRSDRSLTPNFILAKGSNYDQPMTVVGGLTPLPPRSSTTLTLSTPMTPLTPHAGDAFQVQAATTGPDTIATSADATVAGS